MNERKKERKNERKKERKEMKERNEIKKDKKKRGKNRKKRLASHLTINSLFERGVGWYRRFLAELRRLLAILGEMERLSKAGPGPGKQQGRRPSATAVAAVSTAAAGAVVARPAAVAAVASVAGVAAGQAGGARGAGGVERDATAKIARLRARIAQVQPKLCGPMLAAKVEGLKALAENGLASLQKRL